MFIIGCMSISLVVSALSGWVMGRVIYSLDMERASDSSDNERPTWRHRAAASGFSVAVAMTLVLLSWLEWWDALAIGVLLVCPAVYVFRQMYKVTVLDTFIADIRKSVVPEVAIAFAALISVVLTGMAGTHAAPAIAVVVATAASVITTYAIIGAWLAILVTFAFIFDCTVHLANCINDSADRISIQIFKLVGAVR